MPSHTQTLNRAAIEGLIPHRAPFLLLDEIVRWEAERELEAVRTFEVGDPIFQGHFPGNPLVPGVLMVEALAQAAASLVSLSRGLTNDTATYLFSGIDEVRFKRVVRPDEQLRLMVRQEGLRLNLYKFSGEVWVQAELAVKAAFTAKLIEKKD